MRRSVVVLVLVFGLASCGGGEEGPPTSPTPTPTVTGVAITATTDLLKINQSETFTLTATMSDGSTRTVTGTWRSETPAVATVDSNGRVTGVGSGETTISAESSGARATRAIRVLPDYQGRWGGDWRVSGCTTDGDWAQSEICREVPIGTLLPLALVLTQDRDNVAGNVTLDDVSGPVQGVIRAGGQLSLSGAFTMTEQGLVLDVSVTDWETTTTDNQRMTGRFTLGFRAAGLQGSARFGGELRIVGKSAAASLSGAEGQLSLRRLLTAVTRRQRS